jgi:hypothetical protein
MFKNYVNTFFKPIILHSQEVVIKILRKQLDQVIHQPILKHAQMQDEQRVAYGK